MRKHASKETSSNHARKLEEGDVRAKNHGSQELLDSIVQPYRSENVLWSAETIHRHLLLLGFDPPCPDTIRKYMAKPKGGTDKSQTWLTFLRNHLQVSWTLDFFTVPTVRFQILRLFVILNHSRRQVVHFAVTAHPTMARVIQQLREAMPFGICSVTTTESTETR